MKRKLFDISVITPSYNQGKFIKQTIDSVLSQTYTRLQYLVLDGGSTDRTKKILRLYGKKFYWESKKDAGQSDALNKGLSKSTGDIITYINSDDYYLEGAFWKVANVFIENPSVQWVVGDCIIVDEAGHEIQKPIRLIKKLMRTLYQPWMLLIFNPFPQPAVFWRARAGKKVGLFTTQLHFTMDYEYWLRLQRAYGSPFFLSQPLAAFRIHTDSKGKTHYREQFTEEVQVAGQFSSNVFLHSLHKLSVACILSAYKLIK